MTDPPPRTHAQAPSLLHSLTPLKTPFPTRPTRALARALAAGPERAYFFRLYVAGASTRSRQALRRVHQLCEAEFKGNYELEVIDVYQHPEIARANQIVATPTLVKELPVPVRRFIGSLLHLTGLIEAGDHDPAIKSAS